MREQNPRRAFVRRQVSIRARPVRVVRNDKAPVIPAPPPVPANPHPSRAKPAWRARRTAASKAYPRRWAAPESTRPEVMFSRSRRDSVGTISTPARR